MTASPSIFDANLRAIRRHDSEFADRLISIQSAKLSWSHTRSGMLTATLQRNSRSVTLASRYDPQAEASKLVEQIDHTHQACVVLLGFGLGYHAATVAAGMKGWGLLVIYEPDLDVLRAAMEHIDHSSWINRNKIVFADAATDRAALISRIEKYAAIVTQGTQLVSLPVSRQLHRKSLDQFAGLIKQVLAFCRTTVATALVNSARTCRNLACNLDVYSAGATTDALHMAAKDTTAVCVAAGPSLVKNVDLLKETVHRRNVVVIAAQTALKPLLDRGIRPDFVTALDYSPICSRFYENLPPLPDVTLVAEPKAHPTILENFPGPVRIIRNQFNDDLLGSLARPILPLKSGATVAHLSLYLAQHLGCNPILLLGQDLGFSEGLYYAPGTAIHQVWACELNQFNTLEMMEWQRIVRMSGHLRQVQDIHGQSIFTDEQMMTYLKQFERDFATADEQLIDCTEGGIPKDHTTQMSLADALQRYAVRAAPQIPCPVDGLDFHRLLGLQQLLKERCSQIRQLRCITKQTLPILHQMRKCQCDPARMNKLFKQLRKRQGRIEGDLQIAFKLVTALNTVGTFNRQRTDRIIGHLDVDAYERQRRQIERDTENLEWLLQACSEAIDIFGTAAMRVDKTLGRQSEQQTIVKRSSLQRMGGLNIYS